MVSSVEPCWVKAQPDSFLKAYRAIATSLQTRNPWLAPRKDKFFKRQIKKRWARGCHRSSLG